MSVGHVARLLEENGLVTVIIAVRAFRSQIEKMTLPRTVTTPHLLGRPLGPPGEIKRQKETILAAFDFLEKADRGGMIFDLPGSYRA